MTKKDKPLDLVPKKISPLLQHIKCPISEQINVDKYKVLSDGDFINNIIYLELGYDDNSEYDSSFFIKTKDLKLIADSLYKLAENVDTRNKLYKLSREWINGLKKLLKENQVEKLYINPKYVYCTDIHDDLFSTIVFEVSYTDINNRQESILLLSDSLIMETEDYLTSQTRHLKEKYPSLKEVYINNNQFKKLMKEISTYKSNQLKQSAPVESMKPKASVQELIDGYLKSKGNDKNAK